MFPRNHPPGGSCQERIRGGKKPSAIWWRKKDWKEGKENHDKMGKGEGQNRSDPESPHQNCSRATKKTRAHHQMWWMPKGARFKTTTMWPVQTCTLLHNRVPKTYMAPTQGGMRILGHGKTSQKRSQVKINPFFPFSPFFPYFPGKPGKPGKQGQGFMT